MKDKDSHRSNYACKCVRAHVRSMADRRLNEDKSCKGGRGNAPDRSFCDEVEKLRALDRRDALGRLHYYGTMLIALYTRLN